MTRVSLYHPGPNRLRALDARASSPMHVRLGPWWLVSIHLIEMASFALNLVPLVETSGSEAQQSSQNASVAPSKPREPSKCGHCKSPDHRKTTCPTLLAASASTASLPATGMRRRCRWCSAAGVENKTDLFCSGCPSEPPLFVTADRLCFSDYHSEALPPKAKKRKGNRRQSNTCFTEQRARTNRITAGHCIRHSASTFLVF